MVAGFERWLDACNDLVEGAELLVTDFYLKHRRSSEPRPGHGRDSALGGDTVSVAADSLAGPAAGR